MNTVVYQLFNISINWDILSTKQIITTCYVGRKVPTTPYCFGSFKFCSVCVCHDNCHLLRVGVPVNDTLSGFVDVSMYQLYWKKLILTTVGLLTPVFGINGLLLCQPIKQSIAFDQEMLLPGLRKLYYKFLRSWAHPKYFPAIVPIQCVP